jgi:hypothetical protein
MECFPVTILIIVQTNYSILLIDDSTKYKKIIKAALEARVSHNLISGVMNWSCIRIGQKKELRIAILAPP